MEKKYLFIFIFFIFFVVCRANSINDTAGIRQPAVSGKFYPSKPIKLRKMVDGYLNVKVKKAEENKEIMGIIVPHAGYIYSGQTAGYGFSLVRGKTFDTVVILGSSHYDFLERPTTCGFRKWTTPLGLINVDLQLLKELKSKFEIDINNNIFVPEHSLEVELPFLQRTLKGEFKIFPILINEFRIEKIKRFAVKLAQIFKNKNNILFVISTDMSHYFRAEVAEKMDKKVNQAIINRDYKMLEKLLKTKEGQLCGEGGVMLGLLTLKEMGADEIIKLHYSHSGMVTGDNSGVVGYGAFGIYKTKGPRKGVRPKRQEKQMGLNDQQKIKLLEIARKTIETYIREGRKIEINVEDEELKVERGVFVTIHKNGRLKGCIGNIMPINKLYLAVQEMAIQSSTNDPRFTAVNEDELNNIEIEISVLTVPRKVENVEDIVMERDGVIVKNGFRQGVYLPQVATETGWSREEFLSSLCYSKAGLSPDAWKDKSTQLFNFQAEVFSEKEMGVK